MLEGYVVMEGGGKTPLYAELDRDPSSGRGGCRGAVWLRLCMLPRRSSFLWVV